MNKWISLVTGVILLTLSSCSKRQEETKREIEQIADNK